MTRTWALPPLSAGEFVPKFSAPTRQNANFHFDTVAGRYVVLGFAPPGAAAQAAAQAALASVRRRLDDLNVCGMLVAPAADFSDVPPDDLPGIRWFLDPQGAVAASFGLQSGWFLLDPLLRVMARAPIDAPEPLLAQVATLPPPGLHAGPPLVAPVLIVPRVFEPEFCRQLMDHYDAQGGQPSGVMRDIGGKTVGVLDSMKSRRDVLIQEPELKQGVMRALERCLSPMIERAFHFKATRLERYLIACYDAKEGGYFRPHRDNQTFATAHRKFAVSINLNAEDFEGGDLRFPEFGPRTYRPPTGGAVVFCCSLLHEATPVTRGRRYAVLPFLYDMAGEEVRQQNLHKLDPALAPKPAPQ
jgi:predicted 2-oxoglutarate/Fe(II)-dependent dioxygenase YbiX